MNDRFEFSPSDHGGHASDEDVARLGVEAFERAQRGRRDPEPPRRKPDPLSAAKEADTGRVDALPWATAHEDFRRSIVQEQRERDAELLPRQDTAALYEAYKKRLGLDKEDRTKDVGPAS